MKIEIKSRFTGEVVFAHDAEGNTTRRTVEAAVAARANLAGANLAGAYLARANLARANLAGAYLAGAYLAGANLAGAYLDGAYLAGANLDGANLDGANLDGEVLTKAPVSICNLGWNVLITAEYMRIGCQRHKHDEWAAFDDRTIDGMATGALVFWNQWKTALLAMCEQHRKG